jgi:hypothetical protein
MSRNEALNRALENLQASSGDVQACAVVSEDGLIIASSLPQNMDESHIGAMSAAMLTMGSRTAIELKRGKLQQLFVKGDSGYVIMMYAGPHAVLLAVTGKDAKLGLIFFDLARAAEEVENILL